MCIGLLWRREIGRKYAIERERERERNKTTIERDVVDAPAGRELDVSGLHVSVEEEQSNVLINVRAQKCLPISFYFFLFSLSVFVSFFSLS